MACPPLGETPLPLLSFAGMTAVGLHYRRATGLLMVAFGASWASGQEWHSEKMDEHDRGPGSGERESWGRAIPWSESGWETAALL